MTKFDLYEYWLCLLASPNAPSTCMQIVNIFQHYLNKLILVYLDDIIIYSKGLDKNLEHFHLVFDILHQTRVANQNQEIFL